MKTLKYILLLLIFSSFTNTNVYGKSVAETNNFEIHKGINIASWLSTPKYSGDSRVAFFNEEDVKLLSNLGFDHIRLLIDEVVLWEENGTKIRTYGFDLLHNAIGWCAKYGMKAIVDLHITRNHRFTLPENILFTDPNEPAKFVKLWEDLSDELSKYPNSLVAYELLNEPCSGDAENWNCVSTLATNAIRVKEADRTIVVGVCAKNGSTPQYSALKLPSTHKILMTFHFYGPYLLTYYGAQSTTGGRKDIPIQYPGQLVSDEWISALPSNWQSTGQRVYTKETLATSILQGINRAKALNVPVFLGEFGTWNVTPEPARTNWYRDVIAILEENNTPYTSFDYKGAGYSVVSEDRQVRYPEIVSLITGNSTNESIITFVDKPSDIVLTAAQFTVSNGIVEINIDADKVGEQFQFSYSNDHTILKKITFQTSDDKRFEYFFPPMQTLNGGEQILSIAPPQLLSYWQGGIIMEIDETALRAGVDAYTISGKVVAPERSLGTRTWFPNGNINVMEAMNTTDGMANQAAIITALGGIGANGNTFAARWTYWLRAGGYSDWYLPTTSEYMTFYSFFSQDKDAFNDLWASYGGERFVYGQASGNTINFWTSENMNATQAKMAVMSEAGSVAPGTKVYGCHVLAFRKFQYTDQGQITSLVKQIGIVEESILSVRGNTLSVTDVTLHTEMAVYDLSGRTIFLKNINSEYSINIPLRGVFIVILKNKDGYIKKKIVL